MQMQRFAATSSIDYLQTLISYLIALVGIFTSRGTYICLQICLITTLELFNTQSVLEILSFIFYPEFLQRNKYNVIFNKVNILNPGSP